MDEVTETAFQRRRRQRREAVARMAHAGATVAGMVEALEVTRATVFADLKVLGISMAGRGGLAARYEAALRSIADGCLDAAELARATLEGR